MSRKPLTIPLTILIFMNGKEFKIRNKMRIRNFIYESISMAIAGGLLAACTNEYDTQAIYNGEKVPMTFTAGLTQTRTVLAS